MDAKLRELERRWHTSGLLTDEVACLHERVRLGQLTPNRLRLAAALDHRAARHLLGTDAPPLEREPSGYDDPLSFESTLR